MSDARPTHRLGHSAKPKPDPIPTPTPRTPSSAYARCDECSTDAGQPCYDSHDRPCAPCPGRVLAPSASYVRRERVQRSSPAAKPRKSRPPPRSTKCTNCGTGIRSDGRYCDTVPCRAARAKERNAKRVAPAFCAGCRCSISPRRKWCTGEACQSEQAAIHAERQRERVAKRRAAKPIPCWWCGVALDLSGNAGGRFADCDRPCCGDHACKRAIKRDRVERERAAKPRKTSNTATLDSVALGA